MRTLALAALALALPLAGCLEAGDPPVPGTNPPGSLTACDAGAGPIFLNATRGGGLVWRDYMPELWSISLDGTLFHMSGEQTEGSGTISESSGLHNLTVEDVRAEMQRMGAWRDDRHYNVTLAYRDTMDRDDAADFCALVTERFADLAPHYDQPNCADGGTLTFTWRGPDGERASSAYCDGGDAALKEIAHAFFARDRESRERVGA